MVDDLFQSKRFRMSEPMTTSTPEQRLAALGLTLPAVPTPVANYVPYRWAGNLLFLSGQGPKLPDGSFEAGRLGKDASVEDGYRAARTVGLQLLAVAKSALGELVACRSGDQAARHGQRRAGLRRPPESHQRLFRPSGRGAWRRRPPCSLGGWDGLPAQPDNRRDRSHSADQVVTWVRRKRAPVCAREAGRETCEDRRSF